jgi:heme A synthase
MANELKTAPVAVQLILGLLMVVTSIVVATMAFHLYEQGKLYKATETIGVSIILLGGSLSPVNAIWICLPFTKNRKVIPTKYENVGVLIAAIGFLPFIIGLIGKYASQ